MLSQQYQDNIATLLQKIQEAEAIIVGGAAGMSAASGYNWYRDDANFRKILTYLLKNMGLTAFLAAFTIASAQKKNGGHI